MTSDSNQENWDSIFMKNIEIEYKVPIINLENDSINKINDLIQDIAIKKKNISGKETIYTENDISYKSTNISNIIKNILDIKFNKLDIYNYNLYNNYYKFIHPENKYDKTEYNCCLNKRNYNSSLKKWMIPIVKEKKNIYVNTNYNCEEHNEYMYDCNQTGIDIKIPNLKYVKQEPGDVLNHNINKQYNKLSILSIKHLEEMVQYFDNNTGDRIDGGGLQNGDNNLPADYNDYRNQVLEEIKKDINHLSFLRDLKNRIKNIEETYLYTKARHTTRRYSRTEPYLKIFKIDYMDINDDTIIRDYIDTYKKKFLEQDKINQFLNKNLIQLEMVWHYNFNKENETFEEDVNDNSLKNNKEIRFKKFKKTFFIQNDNEAPYTHFNNRYKFEESELSMFKQNNEFIYKSEKSHNEEYILNKIKTYSLTDISTGLSNIADSDEYKIEWNNLVEEYKNEKINMKDFDNNRDKLLNKIKDNINKNYNFLNLYDELDYETRYLNNFNLYENFKRLTKTSNQFENIKKMEDILKNYKKEDNYKSLYEFENYSNIYNQNKKEYEPFNLITDRNELSGSINLKSHRPWDSNYAPIKINNHDYINNSNNRIQVLIQSDKLSHISNINFSNKIKCNSTGCKVVKNIIASNKNKSANSFILNNLDEVRISLKGEYLSSTDKFYYKDPIEENLKINYIGDKTTFLDKLIKINHKDLFKGFSNMNKDYKSIDLDEMHTKFNHQSIINKLTSKLGDNTILNQNSINNYLKDYDLDFKNIPFCFLKNLNKLLEKSTQKYKKDERERKLKIVEKITAADKKAQEYAAVNKAEEDAAAAKKKEEEDAAAAKKADELTFSINSASEQSADKEQYFIIQPPIIEAFLHYALNDKKNPELLTEIIENNQCWKYNVGKLEKIGDSIDMIFDEVVKQLFKNKTKTEDDIDVNNLRSSELLFELLYDFEYDYEEDKFYKINFKQPFLSLLSNVYDYKDPAADESTFKYTLLEKIIDGEPNKHINLKKMIKIPISKGSKVSKNVFKEDFENYEKMKNKMEYYNDTIDEWKKLDIFKKKRDIILHIDSEEFYKIETIYPLSYKVPLLESNLNFDHDIDDIEMIDMPNKTPLHNKITEIKDIYKNKKSEDIGDDKENLYKCYEHFINPYNLVDDLIYKPDKASRAYAKLWEVIWPSEENIYYNKILEAEKITFIAEAPGGFIYCLNEIRKQKNLQLFPPNQNSIEFDIITYDEEQVLHLSSEEKDKRRKEGDIPTFLQNKFDEQFYKNLLLNTTDGKIGKYVGDLEKISDFIYRDGDHNNSGNVKYIKTLEKIYEYYNDETKKSDVITADGGIEIKEEEKEYEEIIESKLYFGEIITALFAQRKGGIFILKIKGMFYEITKQLLYILSSFYEQIEIVKPYTSRVFNNEKYVKCYGFKGFDEIFKNKFLDILAKWGEFNKTDIKVPNLNFKNKEDNNFKIFKESIENINTVIVLRQYSNYEHLINLINKINKYKELIKKEKTLKTNADYSNEIGYIFTEYCKIKLDKKKSKNYLKHLISKNEKLGKYIMYPLKMSLTLCRNIDLKTTYTLQKYSENILYILENVSDNNVEYTLENPYEEEILDIESKILNNPDEYNKERYNFIDENCYNISNSNYIKYNLFNEFKKLKYFLENNNVQNNNDQYVLSDKLNDTIWINFLTEEQTSDNYDIIFNEIVELLKNHNDWYSSHNKKEEYKNIINNIKKFAGWHLDKVNFNKCFCRHNELEKQYYIDKDNNICIFCGTNFNNEDNFDHDWNPGATAEEESPGSFLHELVYTEDKIKNINLLDNFIVNNFSIDSNNPLWNDNNDPDVKLKADDIINIYINGFKDLSIENKIYVKKLIIIFQNILNSDKIKKIKNIKLDNKKIIKNLLKVIINFIEEATKSEDNKDYQPDYLENALKNDYFDLIKKKIKEETDISKIKNEFIEFKEHFKNKLENENLMKEFLQFIATKNSNKKFKEYIETSNKDYQPDLLKITKEYTKGGANSNEEICAICNRDKIAEDNLNEMTCCGIKWDEENIQTFNNLKERTKKKVIMLSSVTNDKFEGRYHKFCLNYVFAKKIGEGNFNPNPINKYKCSDLNINQTISTDDSERLYFNYTLPKFFKNNNEKFIQFRSNSTLHENIIKKRNKDYEYNEEDMEESYNKLAQFIYDNILYLETKITNNFCKNIIFNIVVQHIYDKNIYIKNLSLIYYSISILKIINKNLDNNNEIDKIIKEILDNLIRFDITKFSDSQYNFNDTLIKEIKKEFSDAKVYEFEIVNSFSNILKTNPKHKNIEIYQMLSENETDLILEIKKNLENLNNDDAIKIENEIIADINNYIKETSNRLFMPLNNKYDISFYLTDKDNDHKEVLSLQKIGLKNINYDEIFRENELYKIIQKLITSDYEKCLIKDDYDNNNNSDIPNLSNIFISNNVIFNDYESYNYAATDDDSEIIKYRGLEFLLNNKNEGIINKLYTLKKPIGDNNEYKIDITYTEPDTNKIINHTFENDYVASSTNSNFTQIQQKNIDIKLFILKLKYNIKYIINLPLYQERKKEKYDNEYNILLENRSFKRINDSNNTNIYMINFINKFKEFNEKNKFSFHDYIRKFVVNKAIYIIIYKIIEEEEKKINNIEDLENLINKLTNKVEINKIVEDENNNLLQDLDKNIYYLYNYANNYDKKLETNINNLFKTHYDKNVNNKDILYKYFKKIVRFNGFQLGNYNYDASESAVNINSKNSDVKENILKQLNDVLIKNDNDFYNDFIDIINSIISEISDGLNYDITYYDEDEQQNGGNCSEIETDIEKIIFG